jgi:predicted ATPase
MKIVHITKIHLHRDRFPTREHYPFSLGVFSTTESLDFTKPVTFFVGENGTGKSTLLQAVARACNIHIWKDEERTRYRYNKFEDGLHSCLTIEWSGEKVPGAFFASEFFRHFTEILDEWAAADPSVLNSFGSESLRQKSHGQRHMAYFKNRFRIRGLYLLDEPENALSPKKQLALMGLLREMISAGNVQFIIASHSPILLAYPDADLYSFDHSPIRKVRYEETDYFRIYRDFLNNRERYLGGH